MWQARVCSATRICSIREVILALCEWRAKE